MLPEISEPGIVDEAERTPDAAETCPVKDVDIVPKEVRDVTAVFTSVPDVGRVTAVAPVAVILITYAPVV